MRGERLSEHASEIAPDAHASSAADREGKEVTTDDYNLAAADPAKMLDSAGVMPVGAAGREDDAGPGGELKKAEDELDINIESQKEKTPERVEAERSVGEVAAWLTEYMSQYEDQRPKKWTERSAKAYIHNYNKTKRRVLSNVSKKGKQGREFKYRDAVNMARQYHHIPEDAHLGQLGSEGVADVYWTAQRLYNNYGDVQKARQEYTEAHRSAGGEAEPRVDSAKLQPAEATELAVTNDSENRAEKEARQNREDQEYLDQLLGQLSKEDQREVRRRAYRSVAELLGKSGKGHIDEKSDEFKELLKVATQEEAMKRKAEHDMAHTMLIVAMRNVGDELRKSGVDPGEVGLKFDDNNDAEKVLAKLSPDMQARVSSELAKVRATQFPDTGQQLARRANNAVEKRGEAGRPTTEQQPEESRVHNLDTPSPDSQSTEARVQQLDGETDRPSSESEGETAPNQPDDNPFGGLNFDPMAAVTIDRSESIKELARTEAQERLTRELGRTEKDGSKKKGFFNAIKRKCANLWKGGALRGYYEEKYYQEALVKYQGIKSLDLLDANGNTLTDEQMKELASHDTMHALILQMGQDSDAYVNKNAGEKREALGKDGEEYKALAGVIRRFSTKGEDGQWLLGEDALHEELDRARAKLYDIDPDSEDYKDRLSKVTALDNYEAIALYVRGQVEHGEALDNVMEGFKAYRAESREGARTGEILDLREKVADQLGVKSQLGRQAVAAVASVAMYAGGAVAKSKAAQVFSFGGAAVATGVFAGLREKGIARRERATITREHAYGGVDQSEVSSRYHDAVEKTVYDMALVGDLIGNIETAIASGDKEQMKNAYDQVILLQTISDVSNLDLIRYSSRDRVTSERLALTNRQLQLAVNLEAAMKKDDPNFNIADYRKDIEDKIRKAQELQLDGLGISESGVQSVIDSLPAEARKQYEMIKAYDDASKKLVRRRAIKAGAKAMAASIAFSTIAQEVTAFFRDDVQGLVESAMGRNGDAQSTTLLGGIGRTIDHTFGGNTANAAEVPSGTTREVPANEVTDELKRQWEEKGYTYEANHVNVTHEVPKSVSAEDFVKNNAEFHRNGWYHNGTSYSDIGELRLYNNGASISHTIADNYMSSDGVSVSGSEMLARAQAGALKVAVSPTVGTQSHPIMLDIDHISGNQVFFKTPDDPQIADMIANRTFHVEELVDTTNNTVMATVEGSGAAEQFVQNVSTSVDEIASYTVTTPGGITPPATGMPTGLGGVEIPLYIAMPTTRRGTEALSEVQPARTYSLDPFRPDQEGGNGSSSLSAQSEASPSETQPTTSLRQSPDGDRRGDYSANNERLEQNVAVVNNELHSLASVFAPDNVESSIGDVAQGLLSRNGNEVVLNDAGRELIANHMDSFASDVEGNIALARQAFNSNPAMASMSDQDRGYFARMYGLAQTLSIYQQEATSEATGASSQNGQQPSAPEPSSQSEQASSSTAEWVNQDPDQRFASFVAADDATRERYVMDEINDWMDNYAKSYDDDTHEGNYVYRNNHRALLEGGDAREDYQGFLEPESDAPDAGLRLTQDAKAWLHDMKVQGRDRSDYTGDIVADFRGYKRSEQSAVDALNGSMKRANIELTDANLRSRLGNASALFEIDQDENGGSVIKLSDTGRDVARRFFVAYNSEVQNRHDGSEWLDALVKAYNSGRLR